MAKVTRVTVGELARRWRETQEAIGLTAVMASLSRAQENGSVSSQEGGRVMEAEKARGFQIGDLVQWDAKTGYTAGTGKLLRRNGAHPEYWMVERDCAPKPGEAKVITLKDDEMRWREPLTPPVLEVGAKIEPLPEFGLDGDVEVAHFNDRAVSFVGGGAITREQWGRLARPRLPGPTVPMNQRLEAGARAYDLEMGGPVAKPAEEPNPYTNWRFECATCGLKSNAEKQHIGHECPPAAVLAKYGEYDAESRRLRVENDQLKAALMQNSSEREKQLRSFSFGQANQIKALEHGHAIMENDKKLDRQIIGDLTRELAWYRLHWDEKGPMGPVR